ncbi:hypothetical protein EA462_00340 [Natrarchaeobius halalkaliphilus]|uniref:Uncharacterized protein n=1 Tax=Natrarchaeobius halalkaliphilus TaxID=1679091 RepID=A0A3N6LS63_9EURY|nr:hypothetical protein EA462_00340 [Natrarchaeobius halalkaliphilus]
MLFPPTLDIGLLGVQGVQTVTAEEPIILEDSRGNLLEIDGELGPTVDRKLEVTGTGVSGERSVR